mmetsp:Transcript_28319/g.83344  ORF Transcript_28319/g.83344 Transcript_28319/m.83344 type:complete len:365 (-) Transcript_28319:262-1356(-)
MLEDPLGIREAPAGIVPPPGGSGAVHREEELEESSTEVLVRVRGGGVAPDLPLPLDHPIQIVQETTARRQSLEYRVQKARLAVIAESTDGSSGIHPPPPSGGRPLGRREGPSSVVYAEGAQRPREERRGGEGRLQRPSIGESTSDRHRPAALPLDPPSPALPPRAVQSALGVLKGGAHGPDQSVGGQGGRGVRQEGLGCGVVLTSRPGGRQRRKGRRGRRAGRGSNGGGGAARMRGVMPRDVRPRGLGGHGTRHREGGLSYALAELAICRRPYDQRGPIRWAGPPSLLFLPSRKRRQPEIPRREPDPMIQHRPFLRLKAVESRRSASIESRVVSIVFQTHRSPRMNDVCILRLPVAACLLLIPS